MREDAGAIRTEPPMNPLKRSRTASPCVLCTSAAVVRSAGHAPPAPPDAAAAASFPAATDLSAETLVAQVLSRNPTLAQMAAAAEAAAARYPQAVSLEDPMFGVQVGPAAFGLNAIDGGYRLEASQKYPWPGKRTLRGENAAAEARAAGQDVEDMRFNSSKAPAKPSPTITWRPAAWPRTRRPWTCWPASRATRRRFSRPPKSPNRTCSRPRWKLAASASGA